MLVTKRICFALLMLAGQAHAELSEWSVPVRATWGYGSDNTETMQAVAEIEPSMSFRSSPRTRVIASARLRLDAKDELEPGRPDFDAYSSLSRPLAIGNTGTAEIRDAYVELELTNGLVRLGKQQIVWGRLDGLKVLDVLNPQSFREFIIDDFERSRIGLWSVYLDKSLGNWRAELAWIPDATGHETPVDNAWFQLTAPRFRFGASATDPTLALTTTRGGSGFDSHAAGLRLSRRLAALDLSAVAYSGLDFEPLGRLVVIDNAPVVERFFERRNVFGLNAETAFGPLALRAEFSLQPDRTFNTRQQDVLDTVELDQTRLAIAADLDGPLNVFMNIQYLVDRVENAPSTLVRPKRDRILTAFLRRSFLYEALEFRLQWYRSIEDKDSMLSLSAGYDIGDNTRLRLAAQTFNGASEGLFGQFAAKDRLTVSIEHTF